MGLGRRDEAGSAEVPLGRSADRYRDLDGSLFPPTLTTTTPNAVTARVHDRNPVILDPDIMTSGLIRGCAT